MPLGLFRRHVKRRSGNRAALRHAGVVGGAGQAEIGDLHAARGFDHDVGGFDVAVDQSQGMGGGKTLGDLSPQTENFLDFKRPHAIDSLLQRLPVDKFHDKKWNRPVINGVDVDDIVVSNRRRSPGFPDKPFSGRGRERESRQHHLDGHHAM